MNLNIFKNEYNDWSPVRIAIASAILLIALILFWILKPFILIQEGEVGIKKRLGKAVTALEPGFHLIIPVMHTVDTMNTREQKLQVETDAVSKDLQKITATFTVIYRVFPKDALQLYKNQGKDYSMKILVPNMEEVSKAITSQYTAEELITQRSIVSSSIIGAYKNRLAGYTITIVNIAIDEFGFSDAYVQSIEDKQVEAQRALKAENELRRVKIEAEQKITQAKAEAESLRLQKEVITDGLIKLRSIEVMSKAVDKWNGTPPYIIGSSSGQIIDVSRFLPQQ